MNLPYRMPEIIVVGKIMQILKEINNKISDINDVTFDLAAVKNIDSAGIAFLIYLKSKYNNITFLNPTSQITNLCQLYKIKL